MKQITLAIALILFVGISCKKSADTTTVSNNVLTDSIYKPTGKELKIVAVIQVKPEAIQEMLPVFKQLVAGSQTEEGCIFYNLHQDTKDSTKFVMLEEWKSQEAIDFHNSTTHFKAFQEVAKDKVAKSDVSIIKLVY